MAGFDYNLVPMKNPKTQIRILRLQFGKDDSKVHVALEAYDFDQCPPYVAVSYTWGDEQPMVPITVNGHEFRVRVNCWYSLWQLQNHKENRAIWIDSICINQTDIPEKNAQVTTIGRIYSKATLTACSLGPGDNLAQAQRLISSPASKDSFRTLGADMISLRELQHRSYFRRIWIKQEIILSKDLRLYCGINSLDWNTYVDILGSSVLHNNAHKTLVEGRASYHKSPRVVPGNAKEAHYKPWARLLAILEQYGDAECHDPLDKVYALIPLLPEDVRSRLDLQIDYDRQLLDLCLEMVQKYIREFAATRGAGEGFNIPVGIWKSMGNMIQHQVCPELSGIGFSNFAALWSTPAGTPAMIDSGQIQNMERAAQSVKYAKLEVWKQSQVETRLDFDRSSLAVRKYCGTPYEWFMIQRTRKQSLSEIMSVEQISACLKPFMHHGHENGGFYRAKGDFSLFDLPSHLQVRLVFSESGSWSDYEFYLVPPNIELGDTIVWCRLDDPHKDDFYLPVVRNIDDQTTVNEKQKSVLVGWALFLDKDWSLQRIVNFERLTIADPVARATVSGADTSSSSLEERIFYAHYEDLFLEALLAQDPSVFMTHPRTHAVHPSFLVRRRWLEEYRKEQQTQWKVPQGEAS